jgi:two-component system chemotaxis response regulator CheB
MINQQEIVRDVFAFGGSAGGLEALIAVFERLPPGFPATVCVALHRSPVDSTHLVWILGRHCPLPVVEPGPGDSVQSGHVYVAPRDFHMTLSGTRWRLDRGPKQHRMRPAIDPLLTSVAVAHGPRVVGVLVSGGGEDGVRGLIAIKARGGLSLVQRPDEARHPSMPSHAIGEDDVDAALSAEDIAMLLPMLAAGRSVGVRGLSGSVKTRNSAAPSAAPARART